MQKPEQQKLDRLSRMAGKMGAGGVCVVSPADIRIQKELADYCREPQCTAYGLSRNCPPHVSGPSGFQGRINRAAFAMAIKIDCPVDILLSDAKQEIFILLHKITATVGKEAVEAGFSNAWGFAGGSCKSLFCPSLSVCPAISNPDRCRHPDIARPSMSGFGVDVSHLMALCNWEMHWVTGNKRADADTEMTLVTGLVLLEKCVSHSQKCL